MGIGRGGKREGEERGLTALHEDAVKSTGCQIYFVSQKSEFRKCTFVLDGRKTDLVKGIHRQNLPFLRLGKFELDGAVAPTLSVHVKGGRGCAVCAPKTRAASSRHVCVYATKTNVCACLVGRSGSAVRGGRQETREGVRFHFDSYEKQSSKIVGQFSNFISQTKLPRLPNRRKWPPTQLTL